MVDQRGGAAQGAAGLFPVRRRPTSFGTTSPAAADQLPPYREVVHRGLLFRPQARRQRDGSDRSLDYPLLHRQQYRPARRSRLPQPANPARSRPLRPGEPRVQAPRSDRLDRRHARRDPRRLLHHPARQPDAQEAARCADADPLQDVVAPGRLSGRTRGDAGQPGSARSTSRSCSSAARTRTRKPPHLPKRSASWSRRWPMVFSAAELFFASWNDQADQHGTALREFLYPPARRPSMWSRRSPSANA